MNFNDIPINVISDDQFYRFAPGTKTLGAKELGAKVESDKASQLQNALKLKQDQQALDRDYSYRMGSLAETRRANDMDNSYKMSALDWEKTSSAPAQKSGNEGIYTAAINEMLAGQTRYKRQLAKNDATSPHNYNYYVSEAISLAQKTGAPLSEAQIKELLAQAAALSETNTDAGLILNP